MLKRGILVAALGVALSDCTHGNGVFQPPAQVEIPLEALVDSFGELSDSTGVQVLDWPWVAALSETGRFLAIGDRSYPYLRILDRESDSAWSFGLPGEGPGELGQPRAVEFVGDSALLVLHRQRLEVFGVTGEWQRGFPLSVLPFSVLTVTIGCSGKLYAYGALSRRRGIESTSWVHELKLGPEISAEPRLTIPGPGWPGYAGQQLGFDGARDGILIWHRYSHPEVGYWLPCDGAVPTVWSHSASKEVGEKTLSPGGRSGS